MAGRSLGGSVEELPRLMGARSTAAASSDQNERFGHLMRMLPCYLPMGVFWACPIGWTYRTRWKNYTAHLAWEHLRIPQAVQESIAEGCLAHPAPPSATANPAWISGR